MKRTLGGTIKGIPKKDKGEGMELQTIRKRILGAPLVRSLPEPMQGTFAQILLSIGQTKDVARPEQIIEQGQKHEDEGVVLLEGMVRIVADNVGVKMIEAPDILGEVQLLTPGRKRTATVEVVVGGKILTFKWRELGPHAKKYYNAEEMQTLRSTIRKSAWSRFDNTTTVIMRQS